MLLRHDFRVMGVLDLGREAVVKEGLKGREQREAVSVACGREAVSVACDARN